MLAKFPADHAPDFNITGLVCAYLEQKSYRKKTVLYQSSSATAEADLHA
jgi:hypothetical protein